MKRILWMVTLLVSLATGSQAATIPIGFLSFDVLIPSAEDAPGVNLFSIANFTGDPATGGFGSEDFPIFSSIGFTDSTLTVVADGASTVFSMGSIGPGFGADFLQFADSVQISSATFVAGLSPGAFTLADGSTWLPDSLLVSVTLLPSDGRSYLLPGFDFALLTIEASPQVEVPEPGTALLIASGIASLAGWRTRRRRDSVTIDHPASAG
jgi:hypothetical protein